MDEKIGEIIVKIARNAIEKYVKEGKIIEIPKNVPNELKEKRGVFVTIYKKHNDKKELRGCIGFSHPIKPLAQALIEAAISATEDPRFEPLKENELDKIVIEVSILTEPELIKVKNPKDYPKHIEIGKHGIIIEKGWKVGLLLPQVAVEEKWDQETFLCYACVKAGLEPEDWLKGDVNVYRFSAEIFAETEPNGKVIKISYS